MKPKILVTRPIPKPLLEKLASVCDVDCNRQERPLTREELSARLADRQGVLCQWTDRLDAALIESAPLLKVIANLAVGYDNIDLPAATRHEIMVTNTPGILTDTTADLAFALLLGAARRLVEGDRYVRSGEWKEWRLDLLLGTDVHHATLGIVGLGRIGRAMAQRARGFAMKILYAAPRRADPNAEQQLGATHVAQETLLRESDFISLHCPLKPETRHLIGRRELEQMKPTAILINTARGAIVDEQALAEALKTGRIGGAGLDVFENEPRVHPELLALPNVVLAPHIGSASRQTRFRMAEMATENLIAGVSGRIPPNLVNRVCGAGRQNSGDRHAQ